MTVEVLLKTRMLAIRLQECLTLSFGYHSNFRLTYVKLLTWSMCANFGEIKIFSEWSKRFLYIAILKKIHINVLKKNGHNFKGGVVSIFSTTPFSCNH